MALDAAGFFSAMVFAFATNKCGPLTPESICGDEAGRLALPVITAQARQPKLHHLPLRNDEFQPAKWRSARCIPAPSSRAEQEPAHSRCQSPSSAFLLSCFFISPHRCAQGRSNPRGQAGHHVCKCGDLFRDLRLLRGCADRNSGCLLGDFPSPRSRSFEALSECNGRVHDHIIREVTESVTQNHGPLFSPGAGIFFARYQVKAWRSPFG